MLWNVPNTLTFIRIILIPFFILSFFILPFVVNEPWDSRITFAIFWLASITDWLDGYLARKLNQTSPFGAFLDPVADKLMVVFAIVCLTTREELNNVYFVIPAAIIIGREITISALREWMAEYGKRGKVAVSILGKIKTIAQMLSLMFLLFDSQFFFLSKEAVFWIGIVLLYVAAVLTVVSMVGYLRAAFSK